MLSAAVYNLQYAVFEAAEKYKLQNSNFHEITVNVVKIARTFSFTFVGISCM